MHERRHIGMYFPTTFNLLTSRTVIWQYRVAIGVRKIQPKEENSSKVNELLALVGLTDKKMSIPQIYQGDKNSESLLLVHWQVSQRFYYVMKPPVL
ncbi:DL-methionine transporter ATP-binding subunit [Pasteurella multocida subsp. multocida str. Anand1_cattle]|nr:DL-methionine transporter ATP-binding subunit [Pasteurella multocida subsp. multocida str. Anand1_cattle]